MLIEQKERGGSVESIRHVTEEIKSKNWQKRISEGQGAGSEYIYPQAPSSFAQTQPPSALSVLGASTLSPLLAE